MSPPPPVLPIFLTPPAKESFPVVQSAHEHLRHASDTIHQHRYSLASQLKGFDSRWAHLFSVAPVLNKLTKGRQRPDEFRKNAQGLDDDVQVALEEARKRKYSQTRFADEQDSIIPGPPPSDTIYSKVSRKVKALSSILERVERGDQVQPGASRTSRSPHVSSKTSSQSKHRAKSPTKSPSEQSKARPSKLTVNQTSTRRPARVRKKDSRHSISPEGKTYSPRNLGNVGQPPVPAPPHPVLSAPPAPVIPSNIPPIYARRQYFRSLLSGWKGGGKRESKRLPPSSYPLPTSSYHPQNPQIIPPSDGRGRGRDRSNRSAHRRAGYNGYDNYTYSSTSTPVIPVMATLPNSSSDPINTNIVIPAPSSTRHLSRSRYPPPSSKATRSPYLHTREEYGYKNDHGYNGYNGYNDYNGYGRDGRTGAEYQGDDGHRNPRSPKSPLIMRSKFKENFSVLQSESGR
ncbi:hypothetical protein LENED_003204 [Lentinula edodes]|uniref:Uncharacterized protein n=1 Tax=Lentinula edodes TaxID=5353 RepID=A0A1Q3E2Z1_LENED|nr:hypothetical protein LENED_003204 [Lentinula edodes]